MLTDEERKWGELADCTAVPELLRRLEAEREKVRMAREALETALLYMMAPQHEQDWDAVPKVRAVLRALAASEGPEAAEKGASQP